MRIRTYLHTHTRTHARTHTRTHARSHRHTYTQSRVYTQTQTQTYRHRHRHIYTDTDTHRHRQWAKTADVSQRIRDQFNAEGAGFTKQYPPTEVCLLWPARNAATEAYVYFALLEAKPKSFVGGWTQTSWNPSPMVHLLTREARCNLRGTCFTCNEEGHTAVDCPRGNNGVKTCSYPCKAPGCTNKLYLTTTVRVSVL